jgi:hypothetical protein
MTVQANSLPDDSSTLKAMLIAERTQKLGLSEKKIEYSNDDHRDNDREY